MSAESTSGGSWLAYLLIGVNAMNVVGNFRRDRKRVPKLGDDRAITAQGDPR
jgi:hypothetical protein